MNQIDQSPSAWGIPSIPLLQKAIDLWKQLETYINITKSIYLSINQLNKLLVWNTFLNFQTRNTKKQRNDAD